MFPMCVHYFNPSEGIQLKSLDFVQEPDESADSIHKCLKDSIKRFDLSCDNLSSVSADNANVNLGENKSVY
jgi:hypothetical protein